MLRKRFKSGKFSEKWYGPFTVIKDYGQGTYDVRSVETGLIMKVARRDLKLLREHEPLLSILEMETQTDGGGMWTNSPLLKLY